MHQSEAGNTPAVIIFDSPEAYDRYLGERGIYPYVGGRAKGIAYKNQRPEVVIDAAFYLHAGIQPDYLAAIAAHEQTELNSNEPQAHQLAIQAEYEYMVEQFGLEALQDYHARLMQLFGGMDSERAGVL